MANKPNQGKAGIFRPWDGKLTGPSPGEPGPMPDRNHSWSSVQRKQNKTFTADEVKQIVADAVEAFKSGKELPDFEEVQEEEQVQPEEEFFIGGK